MKVNALYPTHWVQSLSQSSQSLYAFRNFGDVHPEGRMHTVLSSIRSQLEAIVTKLEAQIPNEEPFGIAQGNWSFPGLTRAELVEEAQDLIDVIDTRGVDDVGDAETRLQDYVRRLDFLNSSTIPQIWGNANAGVSAYLFTLSGLRKTLDPILNPNPQQDAVAAIRKLQTQIRGMESRLRGLDPRTNALTEMVERIEQAYNAADRLPTDLESLAEAREKIGTLSDEAGKDQSRLLAIRESAERLEKKLGEQSIEAADVLAQCETAYSAATSVGLAAAFTERSTELAKSMWFWIGGLILALAIGGCLGFARLSALAELLKLPAASPSAVTLNLLLSLLSVGAPVWFAWLATKQIGQRFRLAEDYAFKASVSRAYEGFRREAARHGEEMEARLLSSALTRLDELPLRLVEAANHGSPFHEFASSDVIKKALDTVPGFADRLKGIAQEALDVVPRKSKIPTSKPAKASDDAEVDEGE